MNHFLLKLCTLGRASEIKSAYKQDIHDYAWYHGVAILWLERPPRGHLVHRAIIIRIPFVSKRLSRQRVGCGWPGMYTPIW